MTMTHEITTQLGTATPANAAPRAMPWPRGGGCGICAGAVPGAGSTPGPRGDGCDVRARAVAGAPGARVAAARSAGAARDTSGPREALSAINAPIIPRSAADDA